MKNENIFILGCGYIGKKVARRLHELNLQPHGFVFSKASQQECKNLDIEASLLDLDKDDLFSSDNKRIDFESASIAYFIPPPRKGLIDTRIEKFISYLEASNPPKKILLISTTGVYGDCDGEWIDETRPVNPQADRAHRRLNAEQQVQKYCQSKNVAYVIFRVPGIYAMDKLPIKRITSGEPIVDAASSGYTNRIHAEDLAAFCVEALTLNIETGIYNCCDGHPSTMNDYFMKVADVMNLPRPKEISLQQAQQELSAGMLSYLAESKRITNKKILKNFKTKFTYPDLESGLVKQNG